MRKETYFGDELKCQKAREYTWHQKIQLHLSTCLNDSKALPCNIKPYVLVLIGQMCGGHALKALL
jgi:hypothetical protein